MIIVASIIISFCIVGPFINFNSISDMVIWDIWYGLWLSIWEKKKCWPTVTLLDFFSSPPLTFQFLKKFPYKKFIIPNYLSFTILLLTAT